MVYSYQFVTNTEDMYARVLKFLVHFTHILTLTCVTVLEYHGPDITSKSKIELKPLHITTMIGDIIIISAPIVNSETMYFLSKPNSDTFELKLNISRDMFDDKILINDEYNDIIVKYVKGKFKGIITNVNTYKVFNLKCRNPCINNEDIFAEKEKDMMPNDFMIGPLIDEDHGNWVLSAYYKGDDDEWIELFQVISIEIIESIQTYPSKPNIRLGKDFEIRFAYPVKDLESCEIIAPRSTFDRFYDRDNEYMDSCGFRLPNVTREDQGMWRIIGVGRIVYEANVYLNIST